LKASKYKGYSSSFLPYFYQVKDIIFPFLEGLVFTYSRIPLRILASRSLFKEQVKTLDYIVGSYFIVVVPNFLSRFLSIFSFKFSTLALALALAFVRFIYLILKGFSKLFDNYNFIKAIVIS
jgi:hypothetical protein